MAAQGARHAAASLQGSTRHRPPRGRPPRSSCTLSADMRNRASALLLFAALFSAPASFAAEGMWMPQQVPQLAPQLRTMGLQIDPNRLADLTGDPMGAVISL